MDMNELGYFIFMDRQERESQNHSNENGSNYNSGSTLGESSNHNTQNKK